MNGVHVYAHGPMSTHIGVAQASDAFQFREGRRRLDKGIFVVKDSEDLTSDYRLSTEMKYITDSAALKAKSIRSQAQARKSPYQMMLRRYGGPVSTSLPLT